MSMLKKSNISFTNLLMIFSIFLYSCGDDAIDPSSGTSNNSGGSGTGTGGGTAVNGWLVPIGEVFDGGPGKDGIPALENPEFISASQENYIDDFDLVVGYKFGDEVRAYPHKIFDWHEIVNDDLNGRKVAITHCPLTGTSLGWEREYNGVRTTFGVSGLLYNTNLMPYDRATNSTWTQIGELCVNGQLIGTKAETFQIFETEWGTWKRLYPDTKVLSTNTGHVRNYQRYPYGNYRTEPGLIFSVSVNDNRLPQKERVHGIIINEQTKVYRFNTFAENSIITDTFEGQNIVVIGSQADNFIISFNEKTLNDEFLTFTPINEFASAEIMEDQFGNVWDVFGNAVSGPNQGETLTATNSFIGMFFSWAPFYGLPEIHDM